VAACRRDAPIRLDAERVACLAWEGERTRFLELGNSHGVTGLALAALQKSQRLERLAGDAGASLVEILRLFRRRAALLEVERDRVLTLLGRGGIDAVVLKGAGLASTVFGEPVERAFGDIDLLVPPEMLEDAIHVLHHGGYRSPYSQVAEEAYRRYHFHIRLERAHGLLVELHWGLTRPGAEFPLDASAFREQSVLADRRGGPPLRIPRPEHTLVHLVRENVEDAFSRLTRLVDVDRIVAATPSLDWDCVERTARSANLTGALALALELSSNILGTEVPRVVLERFHPTRAVRVHIALLRPVQSMLEQRALDWVSIGELLKLWLAVGGRRMPMVRQLLGAADVDPLQWVWDGADGPGRAGPGPVRRLLVACKILACQVGAYALGVASLLTRTGRERLRFWSGAVERADAA
jgi:hypothetical protein